jgi:hypothetical protein
MRVEAIERLAKLLEIADRIYQPSGTDYTLRLHGGMEERDRIQRAVAKEVNDLTNFLWPKDA